MLPDMQVGRQISVDKICSDGVNLRGNEGKFAVGPVTQLGRFTAKSVHVAEFLLM